LYAHYACKRRCAGILTNCVSRVVPPSICGWGVNRGEVVVRSIRKDDLHTDYVPVGHSTNLRCSLRQVQDKSKQVKTSPESPTPTRRRKPKRVFTKPSRLPVSRVRSRWNCGRQ
jgi:hypothetical protein